MESYFRLVGGVDRNRLALLIEYADPQDAGFQIFGNLFEDVPPAVAW